MTLIFLQSLLILMVCGLFLLHGYGCKWLLLVAGLPWLTDEINDGHLDWFVFLLAGILFINFIVFVIIARGYRYCCLGTQQPLIPRSRVDQPSKTFGESPID